MVAIAKEHSKHAKTRHYEHGSVCFVWNGLYQMAISFAVADCLKVSLNFVHEDSLNSMLKLVL